MPVVSASATKVGIGSWALVSSTLFANARCSAGTVIRAADYHRTEQRPSGRLDSNQRSPVPKTGAIGQASLRPERYEFSQASRRQSVQACSASRKYVSPAETVSTPYRDRQIRPARRPLLDFR